MSRKVPLTLALHGGPKAITGPLGSSAKHDLAEWEAIKPIFERGVIDMARGPEVMALREKFCRLTGRKYAVSTSSGTAAIHTAVAALGIGRGDEVITSPITDMGSVIAILQQNAVPVFADVDPRTCMITPETVARKLTSRTAAILPVHLGGYPCDVKGIKKLVKGKKIAIVEDVAQAYLCRQGNQQAGTIGDIGCWSLNESKHIGAGDGGMLLMNNRALAKRADLFADKCYDRDDIENRDPFFAPYNYRLSTLTAAVCLEQMKKVKRICTGRNRVGDKLSEYLEGTPGLAPAPRRKGDYATYWYLIFSIDPDVLGVDIDTYQQAVRAEGIWASRMNSYSLLTNTLFRKHVENRHACAEHCPLYKGKAPEYDQRKFPGLLRAMETCLKVNVHEKYTAKSIRELAAALCKPARYFAGKK